jgi:hypothetical protein
MKFQTSATEIIISRSEFIPLIIGCVFTATGIAFLFLPFLRIGSLLFFAFAAVGFILTSWTTFTFNSITQIITKQVTKLYGNKIATLPFDTVNKILLTKISSRVKGLICHGSIISYDGDEQKIFGPDKKLAMSVQTSSLSGFQNTQAKYRVYAQSISQFIGAKYEERI